MHLTMPWVMAMGHVHYSRNLPVHLRDMAVLEERHPALFAEFVEGRFKGHKSMRSFSSIPLDQMHEQLNDWLKNESGTIGNLDDPRTVRREQVARPEMARVISELEVNESKDDQRHHEQFSKFQQNFQVVISFCPIHKLYDIGICKNNAIVDDKNITIFL